MSVTTLSHTHDEIFLLLPIAVLNFHCTILAKITLHTLKFWSEINRPLGRVKSPFKEASVLLLKANQLMVSDSPLLYSLVVS